VFSADKFNTFISLNNLGQILECTHYRLKSSKGYYICIGNRGLEMSNTPGKAPTTLFLIHNIKQLRQELADSVKKAAGKQLLKGSEGNHMVLLQSMTGTGDNEQDDNTEELVVEQDPFDDLLHICICSHLLPLLIHKDKIVSMTDLWNPNHTAQQVKEVLLDIVQEIQRERESKVMNILGSLQAMHTPNTKEDHRLFPVMKQYNIPLEKVRVQTSLVEELYRISRPAVLSPGVGQLLVCMSV
jgi:hypothetical protein